MTLFEYQLRPVGPVLGGMTVYPFSQARSVLARYGELAQECPDDLTTAVFLISGKDAQPAVAVGVCYCGPLDSGEATVAPYRALGTPLADQVRTMAYTEQQGSFDAGFPPQRLHYWKAGLLTQLDADAIAILTDCTERMPSAMSGIGLQHVHGAASRVDVAETAFPHRYTFWDVPILAQWQDPADSEANVSWARETFGRLEPLAEEGVYVNNLGAEGFERVKAAYGANFERLVAVKTRYDPTNFFRLNQNIPPLKTNAARAWRVSRARCPDDLDGRHPRQHLEVELGMVDERFLQRSGRGRPVRVGGQYHAT